VIFVVGAVGAGLAMGVGDYILQTLNETGITIPASANYVALIESLVSSALLILRTLSRLPVVIGIILALVIATIVTIVALPKHYGDVYESL
jgi:riboflavin transporter FmnP